MSIFDRIVSKATGEQEKTPSSAPYTPYRKMLSELEEAGEDARAQYPNDRKTVDDFVGYLKEVCKSRRKKLLDSNPPPVNAEARFILSEDRMCAYACMLPPENQGAEITLEEFLEDMHCEGIHNSVSQEELSQEFERGYFRIFPVARGTLPQAGEDGKVTALFRHCANICLDAQNDVQVDFKQDIQLQPIRKGAVICLIQPPRPGMDGMDVTGQKLPCPPTAEAPVPQGINTVIGRGGLALTADAEGILYVENGLFCIHEQKIVDGDLIHGTLQISGNLYIGGNVDGGVRVEASGDIVIRGKVGQAHVTSGGGTIRVQQGVFGTEGKTCLSAACQIQSPVLENADVNAGTDIIAETILNSTVCCEKTVHVLTGRGLIAGSSIQAGDSILCLRVGNLAGDRSWFSVGYPPHSSESWNRIRAELAEVQPTINKLWTAITELRRKGTRISDGEKSLLEQLVVQRDLYEEKREALTADLSVLDEVLRKRSKGRVQCEELNPLLEVQIGRLTEKITTTEENCNIRAVDNRILLK